MSNRQMCHVQNVFDDARCLGVKIVGSHMDESESGCVSFWKYRNVAPRFPETHPHQAVFFANSKGFRTRTRRRRLHWVRRDAHAFPCGIIFPAMIWTDYTHASVG